MLKKLKFNAITFYLLQFFLSQNSQAHICQHSTYRDLITNSKIEFIQEWSTVSNLKQDTISIVDNWTPDDIHLIQLLIEQFPFSSTPITIEKFEKFGGTITHLYDKQLNKHYFVASFWPGENQYGIIVQVNNIKEKPLRYVHIAVINDEDINCSYFDEI